MVHWGHALNNMLEITINDGQETIQATKCHAKRTAQQKKQSTAIPCLFSLDFFFCFVFCCSWLLFLLFANFVTLIWLHHFFVEHFHFSSFSQCVYTLMATFFSCPTLLLRFDKRARSRLCSTFFLLSIE